VAEPCLGRDIRYGLPRILLKLKSDVQGAGGLVPSMDSGKVRAPEARAHAAIGVAQ
jgi:hypothetical protein